MRNLIFALLCLALFACGGPDETDPTPKGFEEEYGPEMSLTNLNPAGLFTSPSALSSVPEGAMLRANNVVMGRPGLIETRRGFERLAGAFPNAAGVQSWKDFAGGIVGWGGGTLASLNTSTGVWTAYSGTYLVPPGATRVQFAESASCLFFTTSKGLYRLDTLTSTPVPSGVPQALDGTAAVTGAGSAASGFVTLSGGAGNVTVIINGNAVGPVSFITSDAATPPISGHHGPFHSCTIVTVVPLADGRTVQRTSMPRVMPAMW